MEFKELFEKAKKTLVENKKAAIGIGAGVATIGLTAVVTHLGLKGHYTEMQPLADAVETAVTE